MACPGLLIDPLEEPNRWLVAERGIVRGDHVPARRHDLDSLLFMRTRSRPTLASGPTGRFVV